VTFVKDLGPLTQLDPVRSVDLNAVARHPIFEELFAHIVSEKQADATDLDTGITSVRIPPRPPRARRQMVLVSAAALVLALAIAMTAILSGQSRLSGPITTSWEAAHVLPPASSVPRSTTSGWQLVGDIVHTGWQLHTAGPVPGSLTCPTPSVCYVIGDTAKSPSGPPQFGALYVSGDAGNSWSVLPLPSELNAPSNLSCSNTETCAAGGVLNGQSVFLLTTDGGHQWHIVPLNLGGDLILLTCASTNVCNGIVAPSSWASTLYLPPGKQLPTESFVRTTNAGDSWTSHPFPPSDSVVSMNCVTALDCVAVGYPYSPVGPASHPSAPSASGFVVSTSDGGDHWSTGQLPHGFGFTYVNTGISCTDATHCMALGVIVVPNSDECGKVPAVGGCSTGSTTIVSGIATTADGSATWQMRPLPSDVLLPQMSAVSCASTTICWLAGEEAVPQENGTGGTNGGSAVVLGTLDGGATWTRTTFTIPPGAPEDIGQDSYMAIGQISCPTTTACIALGISDQGSSTTPVYSYQTSP
jgi:photosystem II stability/assembly factor-like uncharacterized protein